MTEESRYLSFSGLRVHFRVVMPDVPVKNRMLMLSSPLTSTFSWRKLLPELSGLGCLTVLMDPPGFGRSDCAAPVDPEVRDSIAWGVLARDPKETYNNSLLLAIYYHISC